MGKSKNGQPVRLINKKHRTVCRIIRTDIMGGELVFVCRDETHGGVVWLPLAEYTSGNWKIKK